MSEKKIREITNRIAKEYKPEKIILFGSWAWGKPKRNSDIDLFIIKKTKTSSSKRIEEVDKIFSRREFPMDFLVYPPLQVEENLKKGDIFLEKIINKGKVFYEAAK